MGAGSCRSRKLPSGGSYCPIVDGGDSQAAAGGPVAAHLLVYVSRGTQVSNLEDRHALVIPEDQQIGGVDLAFTNAPLVAERKCEDELLEE